jgi:hypothetical protein
MHSSWRTRKEQKKDRKERILSSGLHGVWISSSNCTIANLKRTKRTLQNCPGWLSRDKEVDLGLHCTAQ